MSTVSLRDAIASLVHDGDVVALESFTHLVTDLGVPEPHPETHARTKAAHAATVVQ